MPYSLTWLPVVLRDAGLKVAETQGWADRGRAEMGTVRGVMCHHTGTATSDRNMPTLNLLINGRPDLSGPLSQLGLARDGTFYVVAAGRANHAGGGSWKGITTGNSSFIGIEAENAGGRTDPWPEVQMDAYYRGVAAILKQIGAGVEMCCGHREYALPAGRKVDPVFDMDAFRATVHRIRSGAGVVRPLIPAADFDSGRPTLRRGDRGQNVRDLQTKLKVAVDGIFGPMVEVAVRTFQRTAGLVPDGIVGPATWKGLG